MKNLIFLNQSVEARMKEGVLFDLKLSSIKNKAYPTNTSLPTFDEYLSNCITVRLLFQSTLKNCCLGICE